VQTKIGLAFVGSEFGFKFWLFFMEKKGKFAL
jgi:hypothetical protein